MEIWTVWIPSYRLAGVIKACAGIVSAGDRHFSLAHHAPDAGLAQSHATQGSQSPPAGRDRHSRTSGTSIATSSGRVGAPRAGADGWISSGRMNNSGEEATQRQRAEEPCGCRAIANCRPSSIILPALMLIVDSEGRYLLVNRYFEKIFHVTSEQASSGSGRKISSRLNWREPFAPERKRFSISGARSRLKTSSPCPQGLAVFLSVKFPLLDQDGNPYAVCVNARDITARKREQAELEEARAQPRSGPARQRASSFPGSATSCARRSTRFSASPNCSRDGSSWR